MIDAIQIRRLSKHFFVDGQKLVVLEDLSLTIPSNEITVLLGRSGCGKTTLLRLISGLDTKYSGTIQKPDHAQTAFIFQEPRLMPWLTVRKNISFGLKRSEVDPDKIQRLIALTELDGFADALPAQLSGGMRQRTALARALAMEPDFILMDEPFASLDHFTRENMQQLLLELHETSSCGVLFVTHSIDEALAIADRIVVLEDRRADTAFSVGKNWRETASNEDRIALKNKILSTISLLIKE